VPQHISIHAKFEPAAASLAQHKTRPTRLPTHDLVSWVSDEPAAAPEGHVLV
jgi:hypothetical protein